MKKLTLTLLACILLTLSLISCASRSKPEETETALDRLSVIESQLASLLANQTSKDTTSPDLPTISTPNSPSSSESTEPQSTTESASTSDSTETEGGFTYEISGDSAVITGYTGNELHLVIPASIDDYRVSAIADSAFADTRIKSVVISSGIEKIGWFAFDGCTRLVSVTVPPSVKNIGYSAFGSAGSSLTVYCHEGSFAQSYAKSYGLSYAII